MLVDTDHISTAAAATSKCLCSAASRRCRRTLQKWASTQILARSHIVSRCMLRHCWASTDPPSAVRLVARPHAGGSNVAEPWGGGGARPAAVGLRRPRPGRSSMAVPPPSEAAAALKQDPPAGMRRQHSREPAQGAANDRADSLSPTDNIQHCCHLTCGVCGCGDGRCFGRCWPLVLQVSHLAVTRPGCQGRCLQSSLTAWGCSWLAVTRCRLPLQDTHANQ